MQQASFHCQNCRQMKLFQREEMSHTPHILASVFLCGFWLPVWAIIAMTFDPPWRCSFCGFTDRVAYLADPNRRRMEQVYFSQQAEENARRQREKDLAREHRLAEGESPMQIFFEEHKLKVIAAGVVVGFVSISVIAAVVGSAISPARRPPATLAEDQAKSQGWQATRRAKAAALQTELAIALPGVSVVLEGTNSDELSITAKGIDQKWYEAFKAKHFASLQSDGFKFVNITNGKQKWSMSP